MADRLPAWGLEDGLSKLWDLQRVRKQRRSLRVGRIELLVACIRRLCGVLAVAAPRELEKCQLDVLTTCPSFDGKISHVFLLTSALGLSW
jgi:hypothetical protein